jgi:hypothetical protein
MCLGVVLAYGVITCGAYEVRTGSRMFGAGACREHLVLEAGGQRDDPLLLFVRSQECEASLVRSGDVRDVVAMTIGDRTDEQKEEPSSCAHTVLVPVKCAAQKHRGELGTGKYEADTKHRRRLNSPPQCPRIANCVCNPTAPMA